MKLSFPRWDIDMENQTTEKQDRVELARNYIMSSMEKMFLETKTTVLVYNSIDALLRLRFHDLYRSQEINWPEKSRAEALQTTHDEFREKGLGVLWISGEMTMTTTYDLGLIESSEGICMFLLKTPNTTGRNARLEDKGSAIHQACIDIAPVFTE
jgi:hypothetical protein